MKQLDILVDKLELQVDHMFDTLFKIQELEAKQWPARHLGNKYKTMIWMTMQSILMRNLWDDFEKNCLDRDKREILVAEIWNATYLHYKELYNFDSKEIANNS